MKKGVAPDLKNLLGVHPGNIHTKFEANLCFGFKEVKNGIVHTL